MTKAQTRVKWKLIAPTKKGKRKKEKVNVHFVLSVRNLKETVGSLLKRKC